MEISIQIANYWWEKAQEWTDHSYWRSAVKKIGSDRRALVIGPGPRDPQYALTVAIKTFLQRAGFESSFLEGDLDPEDHRAEASEFPLIVALPISIGSCVEVLDFASTPNLRQRLTVVLPEEYQSGYFARVLSLVHEVRNRSCERVSIENNNAIYPNLGKLILTEVARRVHTRDARRIARQITEAAPPERSVQGRNLRVEFKDWLASKDELRLDLYRVVGSFVCGNSQKRAELLKLVDRLRSKAATIKKPLPVLVCGREGSGKSTFVREVAKELGHENDLLQGNLSSAGDIATELRRQYHQIIMAAAHKAIPIAFLDEADTEIDGEHAYRHLLPALMGDQIDIGGTRGNLPGVIWFFAASKAHDLTSFRAYLETVQKGRDFLRRFKEAGEIVELSKPEAPQEIVIHAAALLKAENPDLRAVEKSLFYLLGLTAWEDSGQLKHEVQKIAGTLSPKAKFLSSNGYSASDVLVATYRKEEAGFEAISGTMAI